VARWSPVLAQRAASEGPRWTCAVGDQTGHPAMRSKRSWGMRIGRCSPPMRAVKGSFDHSLNEK